MIPPPCCRCHRVFGVRHVVHQIRATRAELHRLEGVFTRPPHPIVDLHGMTTEVRERPVGVLGSIEKDGHAFSYTRPAKKSSTFGLRVGSLFGVWCPMADWDSRFMHLAEFVSDWSKDRSAKVGCVIVGPDHEVRAIGYNGFPRGCDDHKEDRHERPLKYQWTEHAERNAVFNAARCGTSLKDCVAYIPWYPCADCARSLVQSGVKTIVAVEPNWDDERWGKDFRVVKDLLSESGVEVRWFPESKLMNGPVYTVKANQVIREAFGALLTALKRFDDRTVDRMAEQQKADPDLKHVLERVRILSRFIPDIAYNVCPSNVRAILSLLPIGKEEAKAVAEQVADEWVGRLE